jgi:predicted Zn-dependent peptidase
MNSVCLSQLADVIKTKFILSSIVFQEIRESKSLAYSAYVSYAMPFYVIYFNIKNFS